MSALSKKYCTICSKKYGFFYKQARCSNCKLSCCTKCLKKEIEVIRNKKEIVIKVCPICYENLKKRITVESIKNKIILSLQLAEKLNYEIMSCNACTRKYGFFCKESGCPNCGFSFCTKCLKKEIEVPRCRNTRQKVCLKCFEILEKDKFQSTVKLNKNNPIENNIFSLEEPFDVPILEPKKPGETPEEVTTENDEVINENLDNLITKRLAGLKVVDDNNVTLPTDTEMASRLSSLKGIPFKDYSKSDILLSTDTRTDQDKINDLLKQFVDEKNIDETIEKGHENAISEIEKRLASLRDNNSASAIVSELPKDEDDIKQIVQKYLNEAKLPEISLEEQELIADLPKPSEDTEELPWCIICNEDAVIRCIGCDGDLFCSNCYKVCHDDEDFREHKTQTYSKPPQIKENHF